MATYNAEKVYKVFWSRFVHSIQNENDTTSMARLRNLRDPPAKSSWSVTEGDGYYNVFILRIEDSLDCLIESLKKKRPAMPLIQYEDESASGTTEDQLAVFQMEKGNKKEEEAERKKQDQAAKRKKAEEIFKTAKRSRKGTFGKLDFENDDEDYNGLQVNSDSEENYEAMYKRLQASYNLLEKEKKEVDSQLNSLQRKFSELQNQYEDIKLECTEVAELRTLNRQLQEKFLDQPVALDFTGGCFHAACRLEESQTASDSETLKVELGAGISIKREVYNEIFGLDHVRKFTKSLAVSIWGTTTLAGRSVKGKPCRNRNGPKKIVPDAEQTATPPQQESKPPLTPEKLAVISGQMREYLLKRGRNMAEVEAELKNRNRYISDKIQDICSNVARAEARNKFF